MGFQKKKRVEWMAEPKKEFLTLKLSEIKPYPNNPRINDEAVKDVVESIRQCGNLDPIEIDEDNVILSGHTRLKALERLGMESAECVRYTGLSEEEKKKYRILANKTGEKAEWDFSKLEEELRDLDFGDFNFRFDFGQEEKEQDLNSGGEVDLDDYEDDNFECECPRCGFKFNRK